MLDRLDVALRRYEQILATPQEPIPATKAEKLSLWLEQDVCGIAEDLVDRPDFQVEARWPIDHLAAQAATDERALVEAVDADLVEYAQRLANFARVPAVRTALLRLGPHNELLPEGDSKGTDPGCNHANGSGMPLGLRTLEYIARRPWCDLVAVQDYFYPASDLNLTDREAFLGPNGHRVQVGEFLPFLNPRLQSLGDFVARTLVIRVEYWQRVLQRFWVRCTGALHDCPKNGSQWEGILDGQQHLHEHFEALREMCLASQQAEVRHACITLLQVYADYRPRANLNWLGLPPIWARTGGWVRQRLERQHDLTIGEQAATALINLTAMYRIHVGPDTVLETKRRAFPLVVVTGPGRREVHWHGQLLDVDWVANNAPWDLLAALVERVKSAQGADAIDLKLAIRGSLKDRRYRLKSLLPADLDDKVVPAGRGTYRLDLRPEEVCLLRFEDDERLTEIDGENVVLHLA
jgi:hypothetical protein